MSESLQIIIVSALVNAGVTWGVISTKLAWLRRDLTRVENTVSRLRCMNGAACELIRSES